MCVVSVVLHTCFTSDCLSTPHAGALQEYLRVSFNYKYSFVGPVVGILMGFAVFFAVLAVVSLRYSNFQKR